MPDQALDALGLLYKAMETTCIAPCTFLATLVVLIPKPAGGHRPIGLLSLIYSLWVKARRGYQREWDADNAGFWDAAVAGSSALRAALMRRLSDEVAHELQRPAASVLWDIEKFYDSVVLSRLIASAEELLYPLPLLCVGVQVHMGPRYIRSAAGCMAPGVSPDTSMVARDGQSN